MPTVVKTFNYTGTLQQTTIPAGTTSIDVHLWGGAGGGGGPDRADGGTGAAGHHVSATNISMTSHVGKTMTVAVGGGGAGGGRGGNAPGGTNGKSIAGYSGGEGGNSGPGGSSGSGGGGGGATTVLIDGNEIATAGGGGGGGGDGLGSRATAGVNTNLEKTVRITPEMVEVQVPVVAEQMAALQETPVPVTMGELEALQDQTQRQAEQRTMVQESHLAEQEILITRPE